MKINKIIIGNKLNTARIKLSWELTYWCNYRCPYCIQGDVHNVKPTDQKELEEIAKVIRNKISNKDVWLTLIGGEISYLDLKSIIEILFKNNNCKGRLIIATNLSNDVNIYKELYKLDIGKMVVDLQPSYHWVDIDSYIKKCLVLKQYQNKFSPTCVVDNTKSLKDLKEVKEKFDNNNINLRFTLGRMSGTDNEFYKFQDGVKEYCKTVNKESKKIAAIAEYEDGSNKTFSNKNDLLSEQNNFKDYACITGKLIRQNGDVFQGMCKERHHYFVGNLLKEDVSLDSTVGKCNGTRNCNLCQSIAIWNGNFFSR